MTNTESAPSGNDGSAQGDQSFANDAWDQGYFRSHEAELKPEKADKAQTPKDTKPAPQEQKAETPKVEAKTEQSPVKQESQPSQFEKAFYGEDGNLDLDKFLNFSLPEIKQESTPAQNVGKAPNSPVVKQEQWQKDQEEIATLTSTLHSELLTPLEKVYELIQKGQNPTEALKSVYDERKAFIDKHLNEVKGQKEFQRTKSLEERILENTKAQERQAASRTNINEVVSALPGNSPAEKTALFQEILFNSDIGAKVLDYHFNKAVPDNGKMNEQERRAAAEKFVDSITSNKADLRFVFEQCLDKTTRRDLPKIMQAARLSAVAHEKSNRLSAQKAPLGTTTRTAPKSTPNQWDGYFNSHYESADRV